MTKDKNGLLVHTDGDPGDQLADSCRYVYGTWLNGRLDVEMLAKIRYCLVVLTGILRRSPTVWTDPCDCGQDQQDPFIILMQATGDESLLHDVRWRHKERGWRYQTVHWASAQQRNYYEPDVRVRERFGDVLLFIGACIRVADSYINPDTSVGRDQNYMMALLQIGRNGHSNWTRAARWIYCWRRNGPIWALRYYYRNDNPEIASEWDRPVRELILNERIDDGRISTTRA